MPRLDRQPAYVAGLLALLIATQGAALALQFVRGYRPFVRAPERVALSWDMFSVTIARCDLRWDPPIRIGQRKTHALAEAGWIIEWDPAFDEVDDYRDAARFGCSQATTPTTAHLRCFTGGGLSTTDDILCP